MYRIFSGQSYYRFVSGIDRSDTSPLIWRGSNKQPILDLRKNPPVALYVIITKRWKFYVYVPCVIGYCNTAYRILCSTIPSKYNWFYINLFWTFLFSCLSQPLQNDDFLRDFVWPVDIFLNIFFLFSSIPHFSIYVYHANTYGMCL